MKADRETMDDGESESLMGPLLVRESSRHRTDINDLVVDLVARSSGLRHSLPEGALKSLADLVCSMNCYYSNLIEGHNMHPIDIERALKGDYGTDIRKRNLQIEAKAHIAVQKWIEDGGLSGRATTKDGIIEIHRRFCEELPEDLLYVDNPDTKERLLVVPGELRTSYVQVGRHVPVSPGSLTRFFDRFEEVYTGLGKADTIAAVAGAHHRFLWFHPFLDGNGRVARLMSHAMLFETLNTGGIWSVSRGLARKGKAYKKTSRGLRYDAPERFGWAWKFKRRSSGGIHAFLSRNMSRPN